MIRCDVLSEGEVDVRHLAGLLIRLQKIACPLISVFLLWAGSPQCAFAADQQRAQGAVITPRLLGQVDNLLALEHLPASTSALSIPTGQLIKLSAQQHARDIAGEGQVDAPGQLRATAMPMPDTFAMGMVLLSLLLAVHFWQRRRLLI